MRPGDAVYNVNERQRPPKRMVLVRMLSDGPAGPRWEVECEIDGENARFPLAEQALAHWPPPTAA